MFFFSKLTFKENNDKNYIKNKFLLIINDNNNTQNIVEL